MSCVTVGVVLTAISTRNRNKETFVVFCPEKVAIFTFSGIITTNLGKTATLSGSQGAKRRIHHSKSALLRNWRRAFFLSIFFAVKYNKHE